MSQLSILQGIRKPATPPSNRHGGRQAPRPTRAEIAAMLEEDEEHEDPEKMRLYEIAIEDEWDNG